MYQTQNRENSSKKSEWLSKKSLHTSLKDFDNPSSHRRSTDKESQGNTTVGIFLQGIRYYTRRKDWGNTTSIWSSQRNCYRYYDTLQKQESNGSLTRWRYRLFRHCRWSLTRRCISTTFVYTVSRLGTLNIHRSNEKWFHIKRKGQKQMISSRKYDRCHIVLLGNTPAQAESQRHCLEGECKSEYVCFKQKGAISTISGKSLNLKDHFTYLGSNISSIESDVNICQAKAWNAIDMLLVIWSDKIKRDFF